jgi:four helix bundle protein
MRQHTRIPQLSSSTPSSGSSGSASSGPYGFPFQRLDCYRAALELASRVHHARISDAELRDQATRAAKSAFLNLCEGLPDDRPSMRRRAFALADGSLHEAAGAVDLAAAIGALGEPEATAILAVASRLRAMLRGLMRPGRAG